MKHRSLIMLVAGVSVPFAAVGIAFGTPASGVDPVAHVTSAKLPAKVNVNADGVKFRTKRRTEMSVLTLKVQPGGTTGWHSHPGLAVIAVTEGRGTLTFDDCSSKTYEAGKAFIETGDDAPTKFSNPTASPVTLTVTFIAPKGAAIIQDEADPGCP